MKSVGRFLTLGAVSVGVIWITSNAPQAQSSITISPPNPTLLVGQTQQLALSGGAIPVGIATGLWHTCTRFSDQSIRCTGRNNQGQIGNNSFDPAHAPVLVLANAASIRAGAEHACSLMNDGTMQCWGSNYTGQLGDGTMGGFALVPQAVQGISNAISAVTNGYHTCAILSDHTVKCWGRNQQGQVGNGDNTTDVTVPASVLGLGAVADLAAGGYHTCALMPDSTVKCWGRNGRGALGDGTSNDASTPVTVSGMNTASALALGGYHSCALLRDGTVQCWGESDAGQIGTPSLTFSEVPATVDGISGAVGISTGWRHSCAVLSDGTVRCWGQNDFGQLGDGTTTNSGTPVAVRGIANATAVAAGGFHTCVLTRDASVRCWGENDFGEFGDGTVNNSLSAVTMTGTGMTWVSNSPGVASVSSSGLVTAVSRGVATITGTDSFGNSGTAAVTVRQMLSLAALRQGDGTGTVTSNPAGITCGSACSASFISDSQVVMSATAGVDSNFIGWTGCDSVSGSTCTVSMTNPRSVTAIFMLKRFKLTAAKTGIGKGTVTSTPSGVNCGTACSADFVINTTVILKATPALGSVFTGWTGCDVVNNDTCTVNMRAARSVTADFLGIPLD